ncbi:MAG: HepT-like ribonuclease domain-containing protein [Methanothrix sp.]
MTKCIEIVGEATKHIPSSIREKYPEVPWREMAGIRDRLVHGYFKVNLEIVWMTVTMEFSELRPMMKNALEDCKESGWRLCAPQ